MAAGRGHILKPNNFKLLPEVKEKATKALLDYVGIAVLDVLVGAMDRENVGNHLFVALDARWWSIDYSCSFNLLRKIRGIGDPNAPYVAEYFPAFFTAVTLNPSAIPTTLEKASQISDEAIRKLANLPPDDFADSAEKEAVAEFLIQRRNQLSQLTMAWLKSKGLGTII